MNKIFKVIWSSVRQCYVVTCEYAKRKTKLLSLSKLVSCAATSVSLTVLLSAGFMVSDAVPSAEAVYKIWYDSTGEASIGGHYYYRTPEYDKVVDLIHFLLPYGTYLNTAYGSSDDGDTNYFGININGRFCRLASGDDSSGNDAYGSLEVPDSLNISLSDFDSLKASVQAGGGGAAYTAGNGISIDGTTISARATNGIVVNGNGIGVKGSTGITVNGNGVSITPGSVASGNANAITGGTAYSELRPSNGNYVRTANTTAANLTALDTQAKSNATAIANEVTNRIAAVNAEAATRLEEDTKLSNRIGTLDTDGNYIKKSSDYTVYQNLSALDDRARVLTRNLNTESADRQNADVDINNRLGYMADDGYFVEGGVPVATNLYTIDNQLHQATQSLALETQLREESVTSLSDKIGFLDETEGILEPTDTISQNLLRLESAVKSAGNTLENAVVYNDNTFKGIALKGSDGTVITNVANGSLTSTSMDAVNGSQLFATNQNIAGFAADIQRNKENIRELNQSVTAALDSVSSSSLLVDTINSLKADASLNNLSLAGKQVIATAAANAVQEYVAANGVASLNAVPPMAPMMMSSALNTLHVTDAGNGSLHVGEGSYVNGTSSIAIGVGNQVNANNAGAFGDPSVINADASYVLGNDDTINTGAVGSFIVGNNSVSDAKGGLSLGSDNHLSASAEDSVLLGNSSSAVGKNAVALGSFSEAVDDQTVSVGNANFKRRIVNAMDGMVTEDSSDVVTGSQLYSTNRRVQKLEDDFSMKANTDASNIDVTAWTDALGVGHVEHNDTGLVRGGEVYDMIMLNRNDTVGLDFENSSLRVGGLSKYDFVDKVDISKSDGTKRVMTGVATDPKDASSAANVGYVNAVGQILIDGMENRFDRIDDKMSKVGASAAAMASLSAPPMDGDEKWAFSAAVGHYDGKTAGAVGAFFRPQDNLIVNVRGAAGNGEDMIGAGIGVSLNRGNMPHVSKSQMVKTINAQAQQIDNQTMLLQQQAGRIQELEHRDTERANEIAELRQQIAELKKK